MSPREQLETREIGDVTVVVFREKHITDALEIESLGRKLYQLAEEQDRRKLVLNFSNVEFFSSAALGKLISLNAKVKARNGVLKLCNIRPHIFKVFVICKLDRLFDIREEEPDALASF